MRYEKSGELIVAMIVEPMIHRTCAAVAGGDCARIKLNLAKILPPVGFSKLPFLRNVSSEGGL
jgi:hypothetical protein